MEEKGKKCTVMPERNLEVKEMNEVEKKVKIGLWRQRIGYGSSDFACNLIWHDLPVSAVFLHKCHASECRCSQCNVPGNKSN